MSHLEVYKPQPSDLGEAGGNPCFGQGTGQAASAWHMVNDGSSTLGGVGAVGSAFPTLSFLCGPLGYPSHHST